MNEPQPILREPYILALGDRPGGFAIVGQTVVDYFTGKTLDGRVWFEPIGDEL